MERVASIARHTEVELIVMRPEGVTQELPVCLALHGRGKGAGMFTELGVPKILTSLVNYQGVPPFAVVAVDGGDSYWVARDSDDDPQAMLTQDMPQWLGERGLVTNPFAVLGISMGGYGALNYASNPSGPAVALISPALFLSWPEAQERDVFANEQRWKDTDPLQNLSSFAGVSIGVWSGEADPFIDGARRLADKATNMRAVEFTPGAHDNAYWRKVLPEALKFVGRQIG
ncbi:alpha/beta hydrolase [Actinophytocola xinjiangensis]|uniref:alpha/beta hydrolase n=1 Tax=Actinophytocola xinjiangensis TaxID=485602 RepID=UPI001FE35089|nr:alpha/beta hydrolase-fold protein [Actinophytocola xinjiangensis]